MMLPRTPQPVPTESLLGYMVRLSEANGYESPWRIFRLAGLSQPEMNAWDIPFEAVAPLVGARGESLGNLAYIDRGHRQHRGFRLLGKKLTTKLGYTPLRLKRPALCPDCVADNGFIDAFFDLSIAVGCPIHRTKLVDTCEECDRRISLFRPGLLRCKCGNSFLDQQRETIPEQLADLMALLRAKVHGTEDELKSRGSALPLRHLAPMPLSAILSTVSAVAKFGAPDARGNPYIIADVASNALADWPYGFHAFLRRAMQRNASNPVAFRKQYESFYGHVFKRSTSAVHLGWIREEMVRYVLGKEHSVALEKQDIAERLRAFFCGVKPLSEIASSTRAVAEEVGFQVLPARQAGEYLNLPVRVLFALKRAGHLPATARAKEIRGFHQADLDEFAERLIARSRPITTEQLKMHDVVSLSHVVRRFRFYQCEGKAAFVIAYLTGLISSLGRTGEALDQIFFRRGDARSFMSTSRSAATGGTLSQQEAAAAIRCDFASIPGLVERGLLVQLPGREGARITQTSIDCFGSKFRSLSSLARDNKTSSRRLSRLCTECGLDTVVVTRRGFSSKTPFIEIGSVDVLLKHFRRTNAKKRRFDLRTTTQDLSRSLTRSSRSELIGGDTEPTHR